MTNVPGTPTRTVRVPDELWTAALDATRRAGESVSDVINRALAQYIANPVGGTPKPAPEHCPVCGKTVGRTGGKGRVAARHMNADSVWCAGSGQ